jgi:nucleoside-diphosphate-sugar epimerase
MPSRSLITGVSGFVGGHLAAHLLAQGEKVLGTSPDGRWGAASPEELFGRVEMLEWNLGAPTAEGAIQEQVEAFQPEVIYHLAAISIPDECGQEEPTPLAMAVNVEGTRRVLRWAAEMSPRPRVLVASSNHVYAPVTRQSPNVDEEAPLGPTRGYGRTKLAAEGVTREAVERWGCDAFVVRAFQHTGPGQSPRMMLPGWARQFARGGTDPVEVHTLDARIDVTDVRDVVRAYRLLAQKASTGTVYNVGSGECRSSGEVFEMLRRQADPDRAVVQWRPGEKQEPIADIGRLVRLTGWQPQVPLRQTVADTLAWWRNHTGRPELFDSKW